MRAQGADILNMLPDVLRRPSYRALMYDLAERHGHSQFVLYALQVRARGMRTRQ